MKQIYIIALLALLFYFVTIPSAANASFFGGENLMQPMPLPEDSWVEYEKQEGNAYIRMWGRDDGNNRMMTVVFKGEKDSDITHVKEIDDKEGKKNCQEFKETEIDESVENGYPSLTWVSSCKVNNDTTITILHKAISGNDSFYHLRRIWQKSFTDEILTTWKKYMASIYVCDTRSKEKACPEEFKKVN